MQALHMYMCRSGAAWIEQSYEESLSAMLLVHALQHMLIPETTTVSA